MAKGKDDSVLDKVDPAKRAFVRKVVRGTAFVAPVVASFSLDGLTVGDAQAGRPSNQLSPPLD